MSKDQVKMSSKVEEEQRWIKRLHLFQINDQVHRLRVAFRVCYGFGIAIFSGLGAYLFMHGDQVLSYPPNHATVIILFDLFMSILLNLCFLIGFCRHSVSTCWIQCSICLAFTSSAVEFTFVVLIRFLGWFESVHLMIIIHLIFATVLSLAFGELAVKYYKLIKRQDKIRKSLSPANIFTLHPDKTQNSYMPSNLTMMSVFLAMPSSFDKSKSHWSGLNP